MTTCAKCYDPYHIECAGVSLSARFTCRACRHKSQSQRHLLLGGLDSLFSAMEDENSPRASRASDPTGGGVVDKFTSGDSERDARLTAAEDRRELAALGQSMTLPGEDGPSLGGDLRRKATIAGDANDPIENHDVSRSFSQSKPGSAQGRSADQLRRVASDSTRPATTGHGGTRGDRGERGVTGADEDVDGGGGGGGGRAGSSSARSLNTRTSSRGSSRRDLTADENSRKMAALRKIRTQLSARRAELSEAISANRFEVVGAITQSIAELDEQKRVLMEYGPDANMYADILHSSLKAVHLRVTTQKRLAANRAKRLNEEKYSAPLQSGALGYYMRDIRVPAKRQLRNGLAELIQSAVMGILIRSQQAAKRVRLEREEALRIAAEKRAEEERLEREREAERRRIEAEEAERVRQIQLKTKRMSTRIVAVALGYLARKRMVGLREKLQAMQAAMAEARAKQAEEKRLRREERACSKLQAGALGVVARKRAQNMREVRDASRKADLEARATVIQKHARLLLAWQLVGKLKLKDPAFIIQNYVHNLLLLQDRIKRREHVRQEVRAKALLFESGEMLHKEIFFLKAMEKGVQIRPPPSHPKTKKKKNHPGAAPNQGSSSSSSSKALMKHHLVVERTKHPFPSHHPVARIKARHDPPSPRRAMTLGRIRPWAMGDAPLPAAPRSPKQRRASPTFADRLGSRGVRAGSGTGGAAGTTLRTDRTQSPAKWREEGRLGRGMTPPPRVSSSRGGGDVDEQGPLE